MNLAFLDVRPDPVGPVGVGIVAVVLLMVIGLVILAAAGLVFFLWYRKRKLRTVEMIHPDTAAIMAAAPAQPNNPNQP
jgi:hypothetical protein